MQPEITNGERAATENVVDPEAPYGRNPRTGQPYKLPEEERRKRAESLTAARAASQATFRARREQVESGAVPVDDAPAGNLEARTPIDRGEDRAPQAERRRRKGRPGKGEAKPAEDLPPFRAGPIAAGMNRLYVRGGKILRALDWDLGTAVISMTRKESDDDVTVGEAWEEFARVYPKHRVWILKLIQGGAAGQLLMAHAPLVLAILLKDSVRRHLPLARLWSALLDGDEQPPAPGPADQQPPMPDIMSMFGQMSEQDMGDAYNFAQGLMAGGMGRMMGMPAVRIPTVDETEQAA